MMKTVALSLIVLGTVLTAAPALAGMEGPPPTAEELSFVRTDSKLYPDARSAFLRREREIWVRPDGHYREVRRETRKVLNEAAKESLSEYSDTYHARKDRYSIDFARVVSPDGKVTPLNPIAVKEESSGSGHPYDQEKTTSFTFTGLAAGSLTDIQTTTESDGNFLDKDFEDNAAFFTLAPGRQISYTLHLPKTFKLKYFISHPSPKSPVAFTSLNEGETIAYRWTARNLGYEMEEDNMPPWRDFLPELRLSTAADWGKCSAWFLDRNLSRAKPDIAIRDLAARLTLGQAAPLDKSRTLYHWVLNNIRYLPTDIAYTDFKARPAREVLNSRFGNTQELSVLLKELLRSQGIPSDLALLRSKYLGRLDEKIPSLNSFDRCLVALKSDGNTFFLDPASGERFGKIPDSEKGLRCLVLDEKAPYFKALPSSDKSFEEKTRMSVRLDAKGNGEIAVDLTADGGGESELRSAFKRIYGKPELMRMGFRAMAQTLARDGTLGAFQASDPTDFGKAFSLHYKYKATKFALTAGDILAIHLPVSVDLSDFSKPSRIRPLRSQQGSEKTEQSIMIPPGYRVYYLPPVLKLDTPYSNIRGACRKVGGRLLFDFEKRYKGKELFPADYPKVRQSFLDAAHWGEQLIVLERIPRGKSKQSKPI